MHLGRLVFRATVGPLFIGHGAQKLFGSFGGHGLEGTGGFFESIGLRPGKPMATLAGLSEFVGGALVTLGALTPVGAAMIAGTMVTAIRKVHVTNGPWVTNNGFEYNAVLIAGTAALAEVGPGQPSIDEALLPNFKGPAWAALALGAAVGGSYLATSGRLPGMAAAVGDQAGADIPGDPAASDGQLPQDGAPASAPAPQSAT